MRKLRALASKFQGLEYWNSSPKYSTLAHCRTASQLFMCCKNPSYWILTKSHANNLSGVGL